MTDTDILRLVENIDTKLSKIEDDLNELKVTQARCIAKCNSKENLTKMKLTFYGVVMGGIFSIISALIKIFT